MKSFILTHEKIDGEIEVQYDDRGALCLLELRCELDTEQYGKWIGLIPWIETALAVVKAAKFVVKEIPEDLSFERFWKVWCGAKRNRSRAEKIWKRLSKADKVKVFAVIPAYKRFCTQNNWKNDKYPDTWLNDRCFDDDYSKS